MHFRFLTSQVEEPWAVVVEQDKHSYVKGVFFILSNYILQKSLAFVSCYNSLAIAGLHVFPHTTCGKQLYQYFCLHSFLHKCRKWLSASEMHALRFPCLWLCQTNKENINRLFISFQHFNTCVWSEKHWNCFWNSCKHNLLHCTVCPGKGFQPI